MKRAIKNAVAFPRRSEQHGSARQLFDPHPKNEYNNSQAVLFTISEYYDRNRTAFYTAIQGVRDADMDLTGWLDYFVTGLATQLEEVKERGRLAIQADVLIQEHNLNERQAAVLRYLQQNDTLSIQVYQQLIPSTNRRTLQRDLKDMVEKGIVEAEGATHQLLYRFR